MRLRDLLEGMLDLPAAAAALEGEITGLAVDSRAVRQGDLFFALPGSAADGRDYISDALARGAAAVVYESGDGFRAPPLAVPAIAVAGLRPRLGPIADRFYGSPSRRLTVIGITGTNGKTTTSQLLAQALDDPEGSRSSSSGRCAIVGTLGHGFPGALDGALHTTPDAITLQRLLARFAAQQARYVSMEVSSHALDQGRVNACTFALAVFTNLTRDHLDYHGDMARYAEAKARLFEFPDLRYAVLNTDDPFGRTLEARVRDRRLMTLTYGIETGEVRACEVEPRPEGLRLRVATPLGETGIEAPLFGRFNAYNLLAVFAVLLALGFDLLEARARLARLRPIPGRMERFGGRGGRPLVIVDYAHTPDALAQALAALREHTRGRLVCVFGCGGERDRGKRPQMGRVAEQLADEVILTDDNPRREDPRQILDDILGGMCTRPKLIRDRALAIAAALAGAGSEDVVLVAGKGHEDYQQIGEERRPYSDRDTVAALLKEAAA
jgi:UDP-N-acetylmuramoyl-L-alanyl-D-glutamate--2,6-diaminopimelate ligase